MTRFDPVTQLDSPPTIGCEVTKQDRRLIFFLRAVGVITLLAFAAAVMPEKWMIETSAVLGFDPFPESPLTFYLARNLSLLYGFVGAGLLIITTDYQRYRPLFRYLALGTMAFGGMQWIVDAQSALPLWWTLGEASSTFVGGVLIYWLDAAARASITSEE